MSTYHDNPMTALLVDGRLFLIAVSHSDLLGSFRAGYHFQVQEVRPNSSKVHTVDPKRWREYEAAEEPWQAVHDAVRFVLTELVEDGPVALLSPYELDRLAQRHAEAAAGRDEAGEGLPGA